MDSRNLIFPMTAGDLVQSAVIVGHPDNLRSPGFIQYYEVLNVEYAEDNRLEISLRDTVLLEESKIRLKKDTLILVTNISRS